MKELLLLKVFLHAYEVSFNITFHAISYTVNVN